MTYNHEETKVRDPSAAKEVERLRDIIRQLAGDAMDAGNNIVCQAMSSVEKMNNGNP